MTVLTEAGSYCTVYSKNNSVVSAGAAPNLRNGGDVEAGSNASTKSSSSASSSKGNGGRQRFRFNLIFNVLLWVLLPLPLWLPFVRAVPIDVTLILTLSVQAAFCLFWLLVAALAVRTVCVLVMHRETDFLKLAKERGVEAVDAVRHVCVISCYKEPVELIAATVETLAAQTVANEVTMVVSFEERTPDLIKKQSELCTLFGSRFRELLFTIHPFGVEGEIPGKCSNANCGIRTALEHIKKRDAAAFDLDKIVITTCDADSKFHPRYMEALAYKFLTTKNAASGCVFQAPLLYNWNLDALSVVTRVTGLVRAFLMQGALIPLNINSMSIFSFSASLCAAGDFIHPGYQMDDIIALIRWMGVSRRRLRLVLVPVAVVSGPTSGRVVEEEIEEWARQARRWTIGAAEVFHYFMVKCRGIPCLTALSWGITFVTYYGIMLCCSSLYGLTLSISMSLITSGVIPVDAPLLLPLDVINWIMLGFLGSTYLVFLVMFVLDRCTVRLTRPRVVERISVVRNAWHLLLAPAVLLAYSLVEFYALHEVMIRGKKVCKHGASKKDNLA